MGGASLCRALCRFWLKRNSILMSYNCTWGLDKVGLLRPQATARHVSTNTLSFWRGLKNPQMIVAIYLSPCRMDHKRLWPPWSTLTNRGGSDLNLLQWFYREPTAAVVTNGLISPCLKMCRSTRQGDPTSPEPLAATIHLDPKFPRICVGPKLRKVMLYADDILTFVRNQETPIFALLSTINCFSRFSKSIVLNVKL